MSRKFQFKRGLRANLPTLAVAEPAFTTDDGKLHVGSGNGNITMAREDHKHSLDDVSESTDKKPAYLAAASSTDGVAYTATVSGITSLYTGLTITIIPNLQSTSRTPTLNVNGLGAKRMVMPINGSNTSGTTQPPVVYNDDTPEDEINSKIAVASKWLTANKPVTVRYDGTYWETDIVAQSATCLYGTVPIESGGTGANNAADALVNLGISNFVSEAGYTKMEAGKVVAANYTNSVAVVFPFAPKFIIAIESENNSAEISVRFLLCEYKVFYSIEGRSAKDYAYTNYNGFTISDDGMTVDIPVIDINTSYNTTTTVYYYAFG